jgi:transposase
MTERAGKPIVIALTAGQRHARPQALPLLEQSLDRMWPNAIAGDTGDSASEIRHWLRARDIEAVIPYRDDEMGDHTDDREAYRERPSIERTINRLKRHRRIATRDEQLASTYLTMVTMAMILEWL